MGSIALTKLRELDLSAAPSAGRHPHVSAASGLVRVHSFLYVVADDELHLGVFREGSAAPGHLVRLFDGVLPDAKANRKTHKPDFEALILLPAHGDYPHGALLALGSGSTRNRKRGALIRLDAQGAVHGHPRVVDFSDFLAPLENLFPALNIEGAVVSGGALRLFQRGNKRDARNAIIRCPLPPFLDALGDSHVGTIAPSAIDHFDLGHIDGIPFCFTDAVVLANGDMVFTAIAEDTDNTYDDGPCAGAGLGIVGNDGKLRCLNRLDRPYKVEGVDARVDRDVLNLLLVTDGDDAERAACLFAATMER